MINSLDELKEVIELIEKKFPSTGCCGVSRQKEIIQNVIEAYSTCITVGEDEKEDWQK